MGACPAKQSVLEIDDDEKEVSARSERQLCKTLPYVRKATEPNTSIIGPVCPERIRCPCRHADERVALESRKPATLVSRPCGIRPFLQQEKQPRNNNWRSLVEEILREAEPCPPPIEIKPANDELCFQLPKPPKPPVPEWKIKCAETVKNFVGPEKTAFSNDFGPGGDSCMLQKADDTILDPSLIWKNACSARNQLMATKNLLTARYNEITKEVEQLISESGKLRAHLKEQKCSSMGRLLYPDKIEANLGEAIQMLRQPIHNWRTLRKSLKPAVAVFMKAMADFACPGKGEPPEYLQDFLEECSFSYAQDPDAVAKFIEDKSAFTVVHDFDMIFEFLTSLSKKSKDEGMLALQVADQKETLRPWSKLTSSNERTAPEKCSMLRPKPRPSEMC
ncbi:unnamed protein product [Notodromas monacha]|uniref:Uncharacterized protein n=1 Tax=Notodromas monacha TaxID=399045 RepID=A0A7R9GH01_9CRUS|nr:unnamed protein product [Notodromas monacha]CAG0922384.1 unnamed protein product [Notodromas monacha]